MVAVTGARRVLERLATMLAVAAARANMIVDFLAGKNEMNPY
jgi:hypothetical protein